MMMLLYTQILLHLGVLTLIMHIRQTKYSRVPIIRHSVLSDVPCRNTPFYQQSTRQEAE
jgi:hypothetical protein